ncbi:MAG: FAD-binding domain-containing protein [Verrucomicrobiota bacterium]
MVGKGGDREFELEEFLDEWGREDGIQIFHSSREAALNRLKLFVPVSGLDYRRSRNFDYGPENRRNASLLSPYIRNGLISERELVCAVLAQHSFSQAEKFLQEVFWRVYWKGYLENRPALWDHYTEDLENLEEETGLGDALILAESGKTGIECFDTWTRELLETGYLHNHARMWFASIWIFTLKLPWQWGARFFMRHLLDGDPASNTLSWRWVAGLHTKGKTYLARPDNIARYAGGRFKAVRDLARSANALREDRGPVEPVYERLPDLPSRLPPNSGLILLDEDLRCSNLPCCDGVPVLGMYPEKHYERAECSSSVRNFRKECLMDALLRLRASATNGVRFEGEASASRIIEWADGKGLERVYLSQPKVGPWGDLWRQIGPALGERGMDIHFFRFWWENELYPLATGSFFRLKSKLKDVTARMLEEA